MKNNNSTQPKFSYFKAPLANIKPHSNITMLDIYRAITSNYFIEPTKQLRLIKEKEKNRIFKISNFSYVTFSGTFKRRNKDALIQYSGLIVLDFDHLADVKAAKLQLLKDPCFETELLFTSPNGNGLKWIISTSTKGDLSNNEFFDSLRYYIKSTHQIEVDEHGGDIARACLLCHDPEAWIHPKYLLIKNLNH